MIGGVCHEQWFIYFFVWSGEVVRSVHRADQESCLEKNARGRRRPRRGNESLRHTGQTRPQNANQNHISIPKENPVSWIEEQNWDSASPELLKIKEKIVDPRTGQIDNIMSVHSLDVKSLEAHLVLYQQAMRPTESLPKVEREMIAMVVSILNGCQY